MVQVARLILAVLICGLGSHRFIVRDYSFRVAVQIPGHFKSYLQLACKSPDPEIRYSANRLEEIRLQLLFDRFLLWVKLQNGGRIPWLDMLPLDYPGRDQVIAHYLDLARGYTKGEYEIWQDYREATRLFLIDKFTENHQLYQLIRLMVERERKWDCEHQ